MDTRLELFASRYPRGRKVEGKDGSLIHEPDRADVPDRLTSSLDPEIVKRCRIIKPPAEERLGEIVFVDHEQDAIAAQRLCRVAPEREPARVVDVVTENRPL